ncbi:MAG: hypothetical protein JWN32_1482, partial [Solirubrobacterales bacterium]|nr:hypothetical protein [Solirubrobacterales bacterium]
TPTPTPTPMPTPAVPTGSNPKAGVPTVSKPKLSHGQIVFRISGRGSVTLLFQRGVAGHRKQGLCVTGKKKRHGCRKYSTKAKVVRTAAKAGRIAIRQPTKTIHGHRLPHGRYRAVVTPADAAGHAGKSQTVALVLR